MIDLSAIAWEALLPFVVIGFCAQLVDGALGMGFGVVTNTLLVTMGLPPASAAAAVRTAEGFTSGAAGLSHAMQGNVDWPLFARLVVPGIIGGLAGAWLLIHVHADIVRPVVLTYLAAIGVYLAWRATRRPVGYRRLRLTGPIGLAGAALDASGGGWGPVVTGSLLVQGANPRTTIGTVNAAEFFVTVTVLSAYIGSLGLQSFTNAAAGLLAGGFIAAPLGAFLVKRIEPKPLLMSVGILLVVISVYGLLALVFAPVPSFPRF